MCPPTDWFHKNERNSETNPPTPEQYQGAMRKDPAQYITFADIMIRAVHGKSRYGDNVNITAFDTLISKSQEAFTLLLYENGYKNWVWAATNYQGSTSDESAGAGEVTTDSNCPSYGYTSRTTTELRSRNGGWSTEGMLKYNELYRKVAEDRTRDKGKFEKAYMAHRECRFKPRKKRRRGNQTYEALPILDDLGELQQVNQTGDFEEVQGWSSS